MPRLILATIAALLITATVASGSSSKPGPLAGKRVVVVTERIDQPGRHESIPHTFIIDTNDRVYVTRHEASVIHTDTGLEDEVIFTGTFGNMTVSRVQR